jgi:hypothetical protein
VWCSVGYTCQERVAYQIWEVELKHHVQVEMIAGVAYGIIVDGFDGQFGRYQLDVTAEEVCGVPDHFAVFHGALQLYATYITCVLLHKQTRRMSANFMHTAAHVVRATQMFK